MLLHNTRFRQLLPLILFVQGRKAAKTKEINVVQSKRKHVAAESGSPVIDKQYVN
jgi:hypothetical protein